MISRTESDSKMSYWLRSGSQQHNLEKTDCKTANKIVKVAKSATVSCSDLLKIDFKFVYWQDNPTCQVFFFFFFSKSHFWTVTLCHLKTPLTDIQPYRNKPLLEKF